MKRHPKLFVDQRPRDRVADLIEEGIDVAVRVGELPGSRLLSRRLAPHRLCAFASQIYLEQRGTPQHPDDHIHHDRLNFRFQSAGQALRWPFRIGGRAVDLTPNAGGVADFSDAVAAILVVGGIGISLSYVVAFHVERGALVPVLRKFSVERSVVTALRPESRHGNQNMNAFPAFLGGMFHSPTPRDKLLKSPAGK
ncbi:MULTISPECIES: substrate binding domain-containing protein [Methylobacterium]|uniref:substrate binding domain-containing protein n=1 Tax=Methylobacterium TaxID=407 RepID=UPI000360A25D|nr:MULTISPECIES: substrate binding domain-containing protein [Methylobacterium]UIN34125.1 substrate binding domain-containing protein [Methylobacterium oryzae]